MAEQKRHLPYCWITIMSQSYYVLCVNRDRVVRKWCHLLSPCESQRLANHKNLWDCIYRRGQMALSLDRIKNFMAWAVAWKDLFDWIYASLREAGPSLNRLHMIMGCDSGWELAGDRFGEEMERKKNTIPIISFNIHWGNMSIFSFWFIWLKFRLSHLFWQQDFYNGNGESFGSAFPDLAWSIVTLSSCWQKKSTFQQTAVVAISSI